LKTVSRWGDLVTLNDTRGFVEKITLRSVTVRDLAGVVHLIPNNMIDVVSNETRDFSCYMLDIQVDCDEDVDTVLGIIRQIDEEMRHDATCADDLIAPADVVGLQRFEGDVVVMRVRLSTRPHRHLEIGREYNRASIIGSATFGHPRQLAHVLTRREIQ
jgi:moderate conductance mechanosensitive channel